MCFNKGRPACCVGANTEILREETSAMQRDPRRPSRHVSLCGQCKREVVSTPCAAPRTSPQLKRVFPLATVSSSKSFLSFFLFFLFLFLLRFLLLLLSRFAFPWQPLIQQCNTTLLPSVDTVALGMFYGAKYTHRTLTPLIKPYITTAANIGVIDE